MISTLLSDHTPAARSSGGPPSSPVSSVSRHLVMFKTSIRHLVHAKMSLIFGPVQYHLAWTTYAHGRSGQDHISRTFWCGPNVFWTLWARPNFKDPLAWTKCLMD